MKTKIKYILAFNTGVLLEWIFYDKWQRKLEINLVFMGFRKIR